MPLLYKKGGIHINPKNKGKFNATKKKTGKSTEELTHSKNPLTRKRAVFAQNARTWKHKGRKKEWGGIMFKGGGHLSEKYKKAARNKPGGSNVGKYPENIDFAGPSGGAPKGSYPIDTLKHAKSAIKLAHNAPNPEGIKSAARRKFPQLREKKSKKK